MTTPSNWDEELTILRENIQTRLNLEAEKIVRDEIHKILGRVRMMVSMDLHRKETYWSIEPQKKEDPSNDRT